MMGACGSCLRLMLDAESDVKIHGVVLSLFKRRYDLSLSARVCIRRLVCSFLKKLKDLQSGADNSLSDENEYSASARYVNW
ncbi:unnamed protein product [Toxocara canis]|uniref:HMA domain-containing protein n=1 Tax=Toxocara canis TaxID=6265 RepID=A0A183UK70_TOXCA|nr:unnamed protein product [Toxocara canis]